MWTCIPVGTVLPWVLTVYQVSGFCRHFGPIRNYISEAEILVIKIFWLYLHHGLIHCCWCTDVHKRHVKMNKGQVFELGSEKWANFVSRE